MRRTGNCSSARALDRRRSRSTRPRRLALENLEDRLVLSGVSLVGDIFTNTASSFPEDLTDANGTIVFTAEDQTHGREIWQTDNSGKNPALLKDINPGSGSSNPHELVFDSMHQLLYFVANAGSGDQLWQTDGTANGTKAISDLQDPHDLTLSNGALFFVASPAPSGGSTGNAVTDDELYVVQPGLSEPIYQVADINPATTGQDRSSYPLYLTDGGNALYFSADDGTHGREPWKTTFDGTRYHAELVKDINQGVKGSYPESFTAVGQTVDFYADDGDHGRELWSTSVSDPTSTSLVADINQGAGSSFGSSLTAVGNTLYFSAASSVSFDSNNQPVGNFELWKYTGTGAPQQALDYNPGTDGSYPTQLTDVNGTLYFVATNPTAGKELVSYGSDGTVKTYDVNPGSGSSTPQSLTNFGGVAYFTDGTLSSGNELYRAGSTSLSLTNFTRVTDLNPGAGSSFPASLTPSGGKLHFSAFNPATGNEPFVYDPTVVLTLDARDDFAIATERTGLFDPGTDVPVLDNDSSQTALINVATGPAHGTTTIQNGKISYLPNLNFVGTDTFTYTITPFGGTPSAPATVFVSVLPQAPGLLPSVTDDSYTVAENGLLTPAAPGVLNNDGTLIGKPTAAFLGSNPAHGSLQLSNDGSFTYTPDISYVGSDSFTYYGITNGLASPRLATVHLHVEAVPTTVDDSYSIAQGKGDLIVTEPGVLGNDSTASGRSLSAKIDTNPTHGKVSLSLLGGFSYTPDPGFVGKDTFLYTASDGVNTSRITPVTINVTSGMPPVAKDDTYSIMQGAGALTVVEPGVLLNDTDPVGASLTAKLATKPTHGKLDLSLLGGFSYTPDPGFVGTDTFTYTASNGSETSNPATVTIDVTSPDHTPPTIKSVTVPPFSHKPLTDKDATVTFSEPVQVSSFTLANLSLTFDGKEVPLTGVTLTTTDLKTFQIVGLKPLTTKSGQYVLTVDAKGVLDLAGNKGSGTVSTPFVINTAAIAGDYNGDGKADLATFSYDSSTGSAVINIRFTDGSTKTIQIPNVSSHVIPVAGDFDGDGIEDAAVVDPQAKLNGSSAPNASVWIIRQSSDDKIRTVPFGGPGSLDRPAPADFDGDGKTDIATFRANSDRVAGAAEWFILPSGTGAAYPVVFGAAGGLDLPAPADFDGDGKADIVGFRPVPTKQDVASKISGVAQWFVLPSTLNDAIFSKRAGGFRVVFGAAGNADQPAVADYNGDGRADIAAFRSVSDLSSFPNQSIFFILPSQGDSPSFGSGYAVGLGTDGSIATVSDYTGDGRPDYGVFQPSTGDWTIASVGSDGSATDKQTVSYNPGGVPVLAPLFFRLKATGNLPTTSSTVPQRASRAGDVGGTDGRLIDAALAGLGDELA